MSKVDDHWNNKVRGLMSFAASVSRLQAPKSVNQCPKQAASKKKQL